jgi:hypothetical protein
MLVDLGSKAHQLLHVLLLTLHQLLHAHFQDLHKSKKLCSVEIHILKDDTTQVTMKARQTCIGDIGGRPSLESLHCLIMHKIEKNINLENHF